MVDQRLTALPPTKHKAITTSDATDFTHPCRAVWIGGAGDISIVDADGDAETYTVPAGTLLVGTWTRVNSTGTTATDLIAQW